MRFTLSGVLYCLGIATAAYTTVPQYRYGQWLDPAAFLFIGSFLVPYGAAAAMVLLHWGKVALVAAIVSLWRGKHRAAALVVGAICLGLAALSLWNSTALLELNRTNRATTSDAVVQREADLRTEMKAIGEQLALIGWRPLANITGEIAAEHRKPAWENTSECAQIRTGADRRYCARLDRLDGDRTVALEAERLRLRESEVRRALEQQPVATKGRQPDLALLADVLGVSPDGAELLRALAYSILVESAEIALFWVAGLLALGSTSAGRDERDRAASRSNTAKEMSATRANEGRGHSGAVADVLQATPDATPDQTAAVSRATNMKSAGCRPPVVHQVESCNACPRAQQPMSRTVSVGLVDERRRAVAAFVALLPRSPSARASGSALFAAYDDLSGRDGWPPIPPNVFGALLKPAVAAAGGRKIKCDRQVYVSVGVPLV